MPQIQVNKPKDQTICIKHKVLLYVPKAIFNFHVVPAVSAKLYAHESLP